MLKNRSTVIILEKGIVNSFKNKTEFMLLKVTIMWFKTLQMKRANLFEIVKLLDYIIMYLKILCLWITSGK